MRKEPVDVIRDGKEQNARSGIMSVKYPIVTTMAIALMVNVSVPEAIQGNSVSKWTAKILHVQAMAFVYRVLVSVEKAGGGLIVT
jgi:hypothetical protein